VREPFTALLLNRYRPDVVFSPMQTIGSLGRRFGLILTLHDTIYYRHRTPPRDLPWYVRLGWRLFHLSYVPQRLTLNAADVVATVSETSAAEFARVKLTKRPVVVIPNAPQRLAALLPPEAAVEPGAQNLVYMGSFMPYKNVETLIRAAASLPGRTLHLLSRISPDPPRRARGPRRSGGAAVVFHGGVTDAEYAALLADRAVLVSASLDEGTAAGGRSARTRRAGRRHGHADLPRGRGGGALYAPGRTPRRSPPPCGRSTTRPAGRGRRRRYRAHRPLRLGALGRCTARRGAEGVASPHVNSGNSADSAASNRCDRAIGSDHRSFRAPPRGRRGRRRSGQP
jgi:hypothetical protein